MTEGRTTRLLRGKSEIRRAFEVEDQSQELAEAELATELQRARETGAAETRAELSASYEQKCADHAARLSDALGELSQLRSALTSEHKRLMIELALEAASRIARARIEAGDPMVQRVLDEAVGVVPTATELKIRIHPDELDATRQHFSPSDRSTVEWIGDDTLELGGCVVTAESGNIDATMQTARARLREAALGEGES